MEIAKRDYTASVIIGVLAALLAKPLLSNLNIKTPYIFVAAALILMCPLGIFVARLLGKKIVSLYQFGKFGETGGLNTLVDFGVLNLLILVFGVSTGLLYTLFKGTSFIVAVTNSYFWNKHWVFRDKRLEKFSKEEMLKFFLVSFVGFFINITAATLIVRFGGSFLNLDSKVIANLGAAAAMGMTMVFNFFGYKLFVFVASKK